MNLWDSAKFDSVCWAANLEVKAKRDWQLIKVPFTAFSPDSFSTNLGYQALRDCPPMNRQAIHSVSILLSKNVKFVEGDFLLDFYDIKPYN